MKNRVLPEVGLYAAVVATVGLLLVKVFNLLNRPFDVPFTYRGDAMSGGSQFKAVLDNGWYESNPQLSAPFGQQMRDFPLADNTQFLFAKVADVFTDDWVVAYNAAYMATFFLAAVAGAYFFRSVGIDRWLTFAMAVLYAFLPYHFLRGQSHLSLSFYFVIPLMAVLLVRALSDEPLWTRGQSEGLRRWVSGRSLATAATLVVVGTTSSYYAVFGLILMSVVVVALVLRRQIRAAIGAVAVNVGLIAVMVANMAPDILWHRSHALLVPFGRNPADSEYYAFKLAALLLPVPWHPIDSLAHLREVYNRNFPLPSEMPVLGSVAALGFVLLMAAPFIVAIVLRRVPQTGPFSQLPVNMALLAFVAFLFGIVGGLDSLFSLLISPDIRSWNRILLYIALFSLAEVALVAQWAVGRLEDSNLRGSLSAYASPVLCGALLIGGLVDSVPPNGLLEQWQADRWLNDDVYVAEIEQELPDDARVFCLPAMDFPERSMIGSLDVYQPLVPYLHSDSIAISYGGVAGRPHADWPGLAENLPIPAMVTALAAAGFDGIHLDRRGYIPRDEDDTVAVSPETELTQLLGEPIVDASKTYAFWSLVDFAADARAKYSPEQWKAFGDHLVNMPRAPGQPGFRFEKDDAGSVTWVADTAEPSIGVDNQGAPVAIDFSFRLFAPSGGTIDVTIEWPDGSRQKVTVDDAGTAVERQVVVPTGQSRLRLMPTPPLVGLRILNLQLSDPVITDLALSLD